MRRPVLPRLLQRLAIVAAVLIPAVAPSLYAGPASARDLSAVERHALARTVARFDTAMRRKNVPVIIDIIPPRIVTHIAAQHGVDPVKLRQVMIQQTREVMGSSIIQAFGMDMARARYGATSNGTPYVLVPTTTTLKVGGQLSRKDAHTLAIQDNGRWYLLDLSQPSRVSMFTQVYPEFQGVPLGG